jgi:hypothetical protein
MKKIFSTSTGKPENLYDSNLIGRKSAVKEQSYLQFLSCSDNDQYEIRLEGHAARVNKKFNICSALYLKFLFQTTRV